MLKYQNSELVVSNSQLNIQYSWNTVVTKTFPNPVGNTAKTSCPEIKWIIMDFRASCIPNAPLLRHKQSFYIFFMKPPHHFVSRNTSNYLIITIKKAFWLDTPVFGKAVQIYLAAFTRPFYFQGRHTKGLATPDYMPPYWTGNNGLNSGFSQYCLILTLKTNNP